MNMKQLSTFQTACKTLNFTKSTEILNYAQSSVTSQIKNLESELGVNLFERLGNKLILTPFGENFKVYADKIIYQYQSALEDINYEKNMSTTLMVGATESQCAYKLPRVLTEFKLSFPKVKVIVKPIHKMDQIQADIQNGELDFAFLLGTEFEGTKNLEISKLAQDQLLLVASPENSVNHIPRPTLEELKDETILLTEQGCSYRNLLEDLLYKSNREFSSRFEITNVETLKNCVKANLGIALLPYGVVENELKGGTLNIIDWQTSIIPEVSHFVAWHKDKTLTPLFKTFLSISENLFWKGKTNELWK